MIPSLSVVHTLPSRRRNDAPALSSPAKPSHPACRPSTNHLKPTGTSYSRRPAFAATRSIMLLLTTVFPTATLFVPLLPIRKQVVNANGQIVVRRKQARALRDDAVPVVVGVASERNIELVLQSDEALHRVWR